MSGDLNPTEGTHPHMTVPGETPQPHTAAGPGPAPSPGPGGITVGVATAQEWQQITSWANHEGWDIGHHDFAVFHATDPGGFFVGRLDGRPVAALSVVNYSDDYAFMGNYLVDPAHRGKGYGLATWEVAIGHAGSRVIGLDGMPVQEANYKKFGFVSQYRTIRYAGPLTGRPAATAPPGTELLAPHHLDAVAAYDRTYFPTPRRAFLERWLTAPGHTAHVRFQGGRLTGYGVIRPSPGGHRIGPLYADTPRDAEALFDALTAPLAPGAPLCLDAPEPQQAAASLAASRGLAHQFHTVRMYRGPAPAAGPERAFALTELAMG